MVNNYYQKHKEKKHVKDSEKKQVKGVKIFLKKKKIKYGKGLEKDIKILLKKKQKDNIIWNVRRSHLTTEEII